MGLALMPWQEYASRFLTARGKDGPLYKEVCIVVARQQGKTTLMQPYIVGALKSGLKVMHIAQNRELPRTMFRVIADALSQTPDLFPRRRGKVIWPRFGSGQEEIVLSNGGTYRIAASGRGSARGWSNDIVVIDELREMDSFDVIASAEPTLRMSTEGQMVYLSNAGFDNSVVLNSVRDRAGKDPSLAYLEWSAPPELEASDKEGWYAANPALGHYPQVLDSLERDYTRHQLAGTMSLFETEDLCRWVPSVRERMVDAFAWTRCEAQEPMPTGRHPSFGIAWDPSGSRAALAAAWPMGDQIGLRLLIDGRGTAMSADEFGREVKALQAKHGARKVGFDPLTDQGVAKHVLGAEPVGGNKSGQAAPQFVNAIEGTRLRWQDVDAVTDDLTFTARKQNDERGSFEAVRARDDRPITAVLAAIRAVWLASGPRPPVPKVYAR